MRLLILAAAGLVGAAGTGPSERIEMAGLGRCGASRWGGNVHGIPNRVDRIRALGNAVVPQVAEWIGRRIMEAEAQR